MSILRLISLSLLLGAMLCRAAMAGGMTELHQLSHAGEVPGRRDTPNATGSAMMQRNPQVNVAAFSPDGSEIVTSGWDGSLRLWDAHTGKLKASVRLDLNQEMVGAPGMVPPAHAADVFAWDNRTWMFLSLAGGQVRPWLWDPAQNRLLSSSFPATTIPKPYEVMARFSASPAVVKQVIRSFNAEKVPFGTLLNPRPELWDMKTGKKVRTFVEPTLQPDTAKFSPDGRRLLTCASNQPFSLELWDTATGTLTRQFAGGEPTFRAIAICDKRAVAGNQNIHVYDLNRDHEIRHIELPRGTAVRDIDVTRDGRRALAMTSINESGKPDNLKGTTRSVLYLLNLDNGQIEDRVEKKYPTPAMGQQRVAFSPDGSLAVTFRGEKEARSGKNPKPGEIPDSGWADAWAATVWRIPPLDDKRR